MSELREFLVHIKIDTGSTPPDHVEALRDAEAARAAELAAAGHLLALWRIPGRWANYGLWRAPDTARLHELLDTLPLRPHMDVRVESLDPHPSDPRLSAQSTIADPAAAHHRTWSLPALPKLAVQSRYPPEPSFTTRRNGTSRQGPERIALAPLPELTVRYRHPPEASPTIGRNGTPGQAPGRIAQAPLPALSVRERQATVEPSPIPSPSEPGPLNSGPSGGLSFTTIEVELPDGVVADAATANRELLELVAVNAVHLLHDGDPFTSSTEEGRRPVNLLLRTAGDAYVVIEGAEQVSDRSLSAAVSLPHEVNGSPVHGTPTLEITHSGARGIRSRQVAATPALATLDVGALTRHVAVRRLPDGGEALGYGWTAILTLGVRPDAEFDKSADLLLALRTRLERRQAT